MRSSRRLDGAGGDHRVLAAQRRGDQLGVDAQSRHLPQREVDVEHFVLHADQVDLADVRSTRSSSARMNSA